MSRNSPTPAAALSALLVALSLALASCGVPGASGKAADFDVTLFDGGEFRLSEQIGRKAVALNFWFPSCPPCRAEMPDFQQAWLELQDEDARFLGLFVPLGLDSEQDARDFVRETGVTYDVATDSGAAIAKAYGVKFYPTTIFIDKSGRVFATETSVLDREEITRIFDEMAQG